MSSNLELAGIIVGGIILALLITVGLPVVLSFRHSARRREFEHAERMKALEVGRPWSSADPVEPASADSSDNKAITLGIWVPLGALGIALAASSSHGPGNPAGWTIWLAAGAVGVTGVICGTILALRSPSSGIATRPIGNDAKAMVDDDAFDTVSRRG